MQCASPSQWCTQCVLETQAHCGAFILPADGTKEKSAIHSLPLTAPSVPSVAGALTSQTPTQSHPWQGRLVRLNGSLNDVSRDDEHLSASSDLHHALRAPILNANIQGLHCRALLHCRQSLTSASCSHFKRVEQLGFKTHIWPRRKQGQKKCLKKQPAALHAAPRGRDTLFHKTVQDLGMQCCSEHVLRLQPVG